MGEKSINHKETKKKKKTDGKAFTPSTGLREVVSQPELITKKKKIK